MREYMYAVRSEEKNRKKLPAATIRSRRLLTYIRCMMLIETLWSTVVYRLPLSHT